MAIGNTRVDVLLRKAKLLSDSVAWLNTFQSSITRKWVLDLVREEQLRSKGVDGNNEVIGYYSLTTSLINPKKVFNTPYTLFDTGDFYRSFWLAVSSNYIEINANGDKGEEDLFEKYGEKIIALTDENFQKLKEMVYTSYLKQLRKLLFSN